jgi:acetyl esterase/lipase
MPAGIVLFSPWVDLACKGETMQTRARDEVMFSADSLEQAAALYLNGRAMQDPLASPLYADLSGLPPLLIYASRDEILLSDATRLHARAEAVGVKSTLRLQNGMPHVWPVILMLPEARSSLREVAAFMRERVPETGTDMAART